MTGETMDFTFTPKGMEIDCSGFKGQACITEVEKYIRFMKDNGVDIKKKDVRMKGDMSVAKAEKVASAN